MKNSIGISCLFLTCCLTFHSTSGQKSISSASSFTEKFEEKVTNVFQEKVFLHTDKSIYVTGETIWFKAYCVDAASHERSLLSKVLNIELLDPQGQAVKQSRIHLQDGLGNGQLLITPDLVSGNHSLRAYTSWMKNFDADFVFTKDIEIINPTLAPKGDSLRLSKPQFIVSFFPEGGDLVYELQSKIALKIADSAGYGVEVSGVILDGSQQEIARFNTSKLGFAAFNLTPKTGQSYRAVIHTPEDKNGPYELPAPMANGLVLSVQRQQNKTLTVNVQAKDDAAKVVYLAIHTRGVLHTLETLQLDKKQARFLISPGTLKEGITHITLLNDAFVPVCERLVFSDLENSHTLAITTDQPQYGAREKVVVKLNAAVPKPAHLSVSVYKDDDYLPATNDNICSNLLLTSDLKGFIENPAYYFLPSPDQKEAELDLLLLSQGWRRFFWKEVITGEKKIMPYPLELNGPMLSGKVMDREETDFLYAGFSGKNAVVNAYPIKQNGDFHYEVPFGVKNSKVIFWCSGKTLSENALTLHSPFLLWKNSTNHGILPPNPKLRTYLEHQVANIQIAQIYTTQTHINGLVPLKKVVARPFYGAAETTYRLDDYTRFTTIRDLFIEYLYTSAFLRTRNKENYIDIQMEDDDDVTSPALVLLDGIAIQNVDFILDIDPLNIEQIDVVKRPYLIGGEVHEGMINFISYHGDLGGVELPESLIKKVYHSLQTPREFYKPVYEPSQSTDLKRVPDFRNVLHWGPNLRMDASGALEIDCYTSDEFGNYKIEINGLTDDGTPVFGMYKFVIGGA